MWKDIVLSGDLIFPDEEVVRFLAAQGRDGSGRNAIDMGCGAGRHLAVLHKYRYSCYGLDEYSELFERAKKNFPVLKDECTFIQGTHEDIEAVDVNFDIVLAWGSLFYASREKIEEYLTKIYGKMNCGGHFFADFRTKGNWFYGFGRELSEGTFLLDARAEGYAGLTYFFTDRQPLKKMYEQCGFVVDSMEDKSCTHKNGTRRHSWLVVRAHKE